MLINNIPNIFIVFLLFLIGGTSVDVSSTIEATYSSVLTENHTIYSRPFSSGSIYYYETIEVVTTKSGLHTVVIDGRINPIAYLYKGYFDRFKTTHSQLDLITGYSDRNHFNATFELLIDTRYILVVTTFNSSVIGPFSITLFGSSIVQLERIHIEQFIESNYTSALSKDRDKYYALSCDFIPEYYYEAIQINVNKSDFYTVFGSVANINIGLVMFIYEHDFYAVIPRGNLSVQHDICIGTDLRHTTTKLLANIRYILVITTCSSSKTVDFSIQVLGRNNVSLRRTHSSLGFHSNYSSKLTTKSQMYDKNCIRSYYYYESLRLTIPIDGYYGFSTGKSSDININLYKNHFDPLNPRQNLVEIGRHGCSNGDRDGRYTAHLESDMTYTLLVTTSRPMRMTSFSIDVYGLSNITLHHFVDNSISCYVGGACNIQVKSIGLTLDDILRLEVNRNISIGDQPLLVKMSTTFATIMFITGIINSLCSILTFQNEKSRTVGCGLYLLASSVTSLLTITIFMLKVWFVVVTNMDTSVHSSILEGGCKSIESILKLFFYWDAWLNACVAVERAANVYKGISFDKEKSKRFARWIIFILPIVIMGTLVHEPLYRQVFMHETNETKRIDETRNVFEEIVIDRRFWCLTSYSHSIQNYNTAILFIHLLGPFLANLFSAIFIIIRSARRRLEAQKRQKYGEYLREQWNEHKQLVISSIILLFLSAPRLIISLLSGCTNVSDQAWLYLSAYFISFIPSILVFVVFVVPSSSYQKIFKESFLGICKRQ
ncbi:unnamed protein product [Adineta ricciae]|uniref:G-protein coupled receptors family 1 profile domain-containing protein n=1 Tax=Adineta ricciae TaxID=249248 RepID=A0A814R3T8_ADIRI|nr:unnamed protein product [Adineta ricciae]CAF1505931.1 unnamed protein product [Adineta ricciae]